MIFDIKHRFNGVILFSLETERLKLCVEAAVKSGAYLGGAYLGGADLGGADLRGADLGGAYLGGADLRSADLRGAYLGGADLGGADLRGADLGGADLGGADLRSADLGGAYLSGAKIRDGIPVTKAPIQILGLEWSVTIWDQHMQIGCEFHSHDDWRGFSEDDWTRMGGKEALKMKREQFQMLIGLCDLHRPKP